MSTDSPAVRAARRALSRAIVATGNAEAKVIRARRWEREAERALALAVKDVGHGEGGRDHGK